MYFTGIVRDLAEFDWHQLHVWQQNCWFDANKRPVNKE